MFRQDVDRRARITGSDHGQNTFIEPPLTETDSTCRSPLLKNLLSKDVLASMRRFFVNRCPS